MKLRGFLCFERFQRSLSSLSQLRVARGWNLLSRRASSTGIPLRLPNLLLLRVARGLCLL
jgi:hypothetical protein